MAFDLLVVPALCWRRTRPYAWGAIVVFHVVTWRLFPIGVFPWLMIAVSTVFFAPDWPSTPPRARAAAVTARAAAASSAPRSCHGHGRDPATTAARSSSRSRVVWVAVQVSLPLRHWVVPGDYRWTNEGYRFAWVVLLTEKGGDVSFRVTEPATGRHWIETAQDLYTPNQWRAMTTEPELIRQAAHAVAERQADRGREVEVRADAFVALNGRPPRSASSTPGSTWPASRGASTNPGSFPRRRRRPPEAPSRHAMMAGWPTTKVRGPSSPTSSRPMCPTSNLRCASCSPDRASCATATTT